MNGSYDIKTYSTRRFVLCLIVCYFVLVFFSPFSIAITSLGEERVNLSTLRTFVRFVPVWICQLPLPLGVWQGLWFVIVAIPGFFSYLIIWIEGVVHIPQGTTGQCHWMCLIIRYNIYGLGVGFWKVPEIVRLIWTEGVGHTPRGPKICVTACVLSKGTTIYMVKGWGSELFLRYLAFNDQEGWGYPRGTINLCHWMHLIIRNSNILRRVGGGFWTVSEI